MGLLPPALWDFARSLIEGIDYTLLWRKELLPLLRTGVSNRFIFNHTGDRGWRPRAPHAG